MVIIIYFNGCYFQGHVFDDKLTSGKNSQFSKNEKT